MIARSLEGWYDDGKEKNGEPEKQRAGENEEQEKAKCRRKQGAGKGNEQKKTDRETRRG